MDFEISEQMTTILEMVRDFMDREVIPLEGEMLHGDPAVLEQRVRAAQDKVRQMGVPCVYQPLKEGYRSWGGGIGLSANLEGLALEAAYEYINWYLSGWVGGYLMRQGYYSAVPETSKDFMSENEWGYWFEGKEATDDITPPFADLLAKAGEARDGGTFYDRMGAVACWNAVMDENQ